MASGAHAAGALGVQHPGRVPRRCGRTGAISNPRIIAAASWLERFLYRRSNAVTVLSDDLADNIESKLGSNRPERVRVIPNFVDTERIRPMDTATSYRDEFGLGDRTVVMYAGNVGMSQSLDLMVGAARRFAHRRDVVFVINGGGSSQQELMAGASGLENLLFVEMQPRERLPEVLASADVHVIPLRRGLARSSVPSKLYSILAAARPVVASVDEGTEVARTVESAEAGLAVPPEQAEPFAEAIGVLIDDRRRREQMGESGRAFVEQWVSPAAVAAAYERLFEDVRAERTHRPAFPG